MLVALRYKRENGGHDKYDYTLAKIMIQQNYCGEKFDAGRS